MAFLSALGKSAPGAAPTASGTPGLQLSNYAPTLATALGNYGTATAGQNAQLGDLDKIINGTAGPTLAQQQLMNATQQNAQAAGSAIGSQRGINPGLAARQIQTTAANVNQQSAGQAAEIARQEEVAAQQLKAQILGQQTGNDVNLYNVGAGAQNQQNTGQIQQQNLNEQAYASDLNASTNVIGGTLSALGTAAQGPLGAGGGALGSLGSGVAKGATSAVAAAAAHGGTVSDDGSITPPTDFRKAFIEAYCRAHGGEVNTGPERAREMLIAWHAGKEHAKNMEAGGDVGGPAPVVEGDDTRNDQTPAMLSRDERVIPASISRDPEKVKAFIEALNAQERAKGVLHKSPGALMAARRAR